MDHTGHDPVRHPTADNGLTSIVEDPNLVTGSPASASFVVSCGDVPPGGPPEPGDFCSQTQGGWGTDECRGNNTACLRNDFFDDTIGTLIVGDAAGFTVTLTSSEAVADLLPTGGTPGALDASYLDPQEVTSAGVFLGQLVAATLNVAFDAAGIGKCTLTKTCDFPNPPGTLGTLVYGDCVVEGLQGLTVNQVIAFANTAIGGGGTPAGVTISDLSDALAILNEEFVDCDTVATGCLTLPE